MRYLIVLFFVSLSTQALGREFYTWEYLYVHDADTVMFKAPWIPNPLRKVIGIRINNIDSPEYGGRAKCLEERDLSERAKQFVIASITNAKKIQVTVEAWDKYSARLLGDVILDGRSLSQQLLDLGYARKYYGEKKTGWCTTVRHTP